MSTWDGGFSPAQSFHPEFGYLCPSARFRRRARGVVVTLAAGMLIAGSMALALMPQLAPQPPGDGGRAESVLSATGSRLSRSATRKWRRRPSRGK